MAAVAYLKGKSSNIDQISKADSEIERLWSDEDDEIVSGPAWSMILIFAVVPLVVLATLVFGVFAFITTAFGAPHGELLAANLF